jgi:hypothetical protein
VRKVITAEMLEELNASLADGTYKQAFKRYVKLDVLYCDEFGYDPFDTTATKHLFRLVSARHEKRSTLLAANTGFKNWKRFLPSEAQSLSFLEWVNAAYPSCQQEKFGNKPFCLIYLDVLVLISFTKSARHTEE